MRANPATVSTVRFAASATAALAIAALTACSSGPTPPPADAMPPAQAQAQSPTGDPHAGLDMSKTRTAPPLASSREDKELPPGHPPIDPNAMPEGMEVPTINPPPPGTGEGETALAWTAPAGWIEEKPASAMRRAQYRVPGPGGDGELIVFYFGPGQGGDPLANAERWASQFMLPDGSPALSTMKTATTTVGASQVLTVEVAGTYDGGMTMTATPSTPKPGYMLLGAIAQGADANWFFKFTGPEATVKAQRGAFEDLVKSLKRGA